MLLRRRASRAIAENLMLRVVTRGNNAITGRGLNILRTPDGWDLLQFFLCTKIDRADDVGDVLGPFEHDLGDWLRFDDLLGRRRLSGRRLFWLLLRHGDHGPRLAFAIRRERDIQELDAGSLHCG